MKTRSQLAQGYVDGTLCKKEQALAENNVVVMSEVKRLNGLKKVKKVRKING